MATTLDETRRLNIDNKIRKRDHADLGWKAWIQADKMSCTWVTTCPKEHSVLNARHFPVAAQTYFGVRQTCLVGFIGQKIRQKVGRRMSVRGTKCDAFGKTW